MQQLRGYQFSKAVALVRGTCTQYVKFVKANSSVNEAAQFSCQRYTFYIIFSRKNYLAKIEFFK